MSIAISKQPTAEWTLVGKELLLDGLLSIDTLMAPQ